VLPLKTYDEKTSLSLKDKLVFMKELDKMIVAGKIKAREKIIE
jgi:hypothetical protein